MYPVAKLDHETDPPDCDSQQADSDAKFGCRRIRTGDNPDNASADYSERNEIRQYPIHAEPTHINGSFILSVCNRTKLPSIAEIAAAFG